MRVEQQEAGKWVSPEQLYSVKEVLALTGFSRAYLYELINRQAFPRPILAGRRAARFLGFELLAWLEARMEERQGASVGS